MLKNNGKIPEYKQGVPCLERYPAELETHFEKELIPRLLFVMTEDDSVEVKTCAIEVMDNLTK